MYVSDVATMADSGRVKFSARAYCKMMLHAAKYPHCAVNGVLLAKRGDAVDGLLMVDAVPMFHLCLQVSPMAEVALTQIDHVAAAQGLIIAGYYIANENIKDVSSDRAAHRVADKIADNFPSAWQIIIDNRHLTLNMETPALSAMQFIDGKWRQKEVNRSVVVDGSILDAAVTLLERRSFKSLIDFDNHLDDIALDWRNDELNEEIEEVTRIP